MIKNIYILFVAGLLFCLGGCSKGNNNVNPDLEKSTLTGTWTLQSQNYQQYINGAQKVDSTYTANDTTQSAIQFNADGSFKSSSAKFSKSNLATATAGMSTTGTYSFTNGTFSTNVTMAGLNFLTISGYEGTTANANAPVLTLVSHSANIIKLSGSNLQIHTEDVYTINYSGVTTTYKNVSDFYYTR